MVKFALAPDIGQGARALVLVAFVTGLFFMLAAVAGPHPEYQMGFSDRWIQMVYLPIVLTVAIGAPFIFAEFSFGYLVGLHFFAMMAAFFWLNTFDKLEYDHNAALGSAALSFLLFLAPALAIRGDYKYRFQLPRGLFDRLPEATLCVGAAILAISSRYGFHLVGVHLIYEYRDRLAHPKLLDYAIHNLIGALIPFAFAICVEHRRLRLAAALCVLSFLLYPVTLTKTALLLAPCLLFMAALSSLFEARFAAVLSLSAPLAIGIVAIFAIGMGLWTPFLILDTVDIRMYAMPAISLDHYYAFFSAHPLTHFCQVSLLKGLSSCPYAEQLGVEMSRVYNIGNLNASLFATEGVASVGPVWAPLSALICGFAVAAGNIASRRLGARFVLVSGSVVAHTLLDVPLSTTLLTNGFGLLILLWFVIPEKSMIPRTVPEDGAVARRIRAYARFCCATRQGHERGLRGA
jgi:hypothetical protein